MADQSPLHPAAYVVLGLVLLASVFLFDLLQPLGVAAGVPYAALVMFGLLLHSRAFVICMAVAGTALTIYGFYSKDALIDPQIVLTNRALAIFLIWTAAVISLRHIADHFRIQELSNNQNIDALTKVLDRKGLFTKLDALMKTARKDNGILSVAIFDLDSFKRVNDCFGHLAGDEALLRLANILSQNDRYYAARLGGEEFVLMMPGASASQAGQEANQVLDAIRNLSFTWQGQPVALSLSAGIAALDDTMHSGMDLVRTADEALLRAKRKGGNRISLAEQSALPNY